MNTALIMEENKEKFTKQQKYKLCYAVIVAMILNYLLSPITGVNSAEHLDGTIASPNEIMQAFISTLLFGIPVLGLIIGALLSFIPFKNMKYKDKYIYFSLLSVLGINVMMILAYIRNLIYS